VPFPLTIAGSDPTGGAGLQADLQVFRSHDVHGGAVVTALTVQDGRKVHQVLPVFPSVVVSQLRALLQQLRPDAVKIGMLGSDDVARAVALGLRTLEAAPGGPPPVVIDPVLFASDGTPLLERRGWPALLELCRGAALVTPNLQEAEALTGCSTESAEGCEEAALALIAEHGATAALVKGGHRAGAPDDLLAWRADDDVVLRWLPGERTPGDAHGTGCALSAAIAARLAFGEDLLAAVEGARAFVAEALRRAEERAPGRAFSSTPAAPQTARRRPRSTRRLAERRAVAEALARRDRRLSNARLATFAVGVALAGAVFFGRALGLAWLLPPAALFVALILVHDRVIRRRERAERAVRFFEDGLARLAHRFAGRGEPGERFRDPHHPYAEDLDLFGTGSLFELLCAARTREGEDRLAGWLRAPAAAEVRAQGGGRRARDRLDLREDLAVPRRGRAAGSRAGAPALGGGAAGLRSRAGSLAAAALARSLGTSRSGWRRPPARSRSSPPSPSRAPSPGRCASASRASRARRSSRPTTSRS
jgi:hydroxymethylpyrimidine kinase/phosphomethylpyrimidine kinase